MSTISIYMASEQAVPNSIPPGPERTPVNLQGNSLQRTAALSMRNLVNTLSLAPLPEEMADDEVYEDVYEEEAV